MRIIVVGAGIGGVTAAIALGRVGADVDFYERAEGTPLLFYVRFGISLSGWATAR